MSMGAARRGRQLQRRDGEFYATMTSWQWRSWDVCRSGWVYAVQEDGTPLVKIGHTTNTEVTSRLRVLRSTYCVPLTLLSAVSVSHFARTTERYIHWLLRAQRIEGEWFYVHMPPGTFHSLALHAYHTVLAEWEARQFFRQSPAPGS